MSENRCRLCGFRQVEHRLVNYADGPHAGVASLICPSATFNGVYNGEAATPEQSGRAAADQREAAVRELVEAAIPVAAYEVDTPKMTRLRAAIAAMREE